MSLLESAFEDVVLYEKVRRPDGEGGFFVEWTEGATFKAAITFDNSLQGRMALSQGVRNVYTVTTKKSAKLDFHDVIMRISDGKIFRITSDGDDNHTPKSATLDMRQVSAEEWSLPV